MNIEIDRLKKTEEGLWDDFVLGSGGSTFYHQTGWKRVIESAYGHKPHYLIAKVDGSVRGILPLFKVGGKLVSMPFAPYGGPCTVNKDIERLLIDEAISLVREEDLSYLELRNPVEIPEEQLVTSGSYTTFIIQLHKNPDILWRDTSKGARRSVNKALKSNLKTAMGDSYLDNFYHIYSVKNRELGAPVHSRGFFEAILNEFPGRSSVQVATADGRAVGAKFLLFFRDRIISGWAASDREYKSISPNSLLTWEILRYGCENNYSVFDFGRSEKNTGSFNFKRSWANARVVDLHYQYYLNNAGKIPDISKLTLKRKLFSRLWSTLPLGFTNRFGPSLRKHFP